MLTLQAHKDNQVLCYMRSGKRVQPVWWHPKVDKSLRNTVEDLGCFFGNEEFRDNFEITEEQSKLLKDSLASGVVPEKHQKNHSELKITPGWRGPGGRGPVGEARRAPATGPGKKCSIKKSKIKKSF